MVRAVKILVILLLVKGSLSAQTYNFRNYSEDEGLPQSYIYDISQAENGLLYISTGEGFATFGGYKFKSFTTRNNLAENFVTTHYTDSRKITWLGHYQNGISYIKNNRVYQIKAPKLKGIKVNKFVEDKEHNIWVATHGGGLFFIDKNFKFREVKGNTALVVNSLIFDGHNNLLLATNDGLMIYNTDHGVLNSLYTVRDLEYKNISCIIPASGNDGSFWAGVDGEGVYGIKIKGSSYTVFTYILEFNSQGKRISCLYSDRSQSLWIGLKGEGLRKIAFTDNKKENGYSILTIDEKNGLINQDVQCVFQDFEGNMWFGTFGGGLVEKPIEKFIFYNTNNGLARNNIKAVLIDKSGGTWLGNENGLNYCEIGNYASGVQFGSENGFVSDEVNAIIQDKKGTIWIGTENNGIYTYDVNSKTFSHFSKKYNLDIKEINALVEDYAGNILAGTTEGLYLYNPFTDEVSLLTTLDGLLHNNIVSFFLDSKDRLWIASPATAPYYWHYKTFKSFNNIEGLRLFNINSYSEDKNGNIWIATEGDGVYKYDGRRFTEYKLEGGLLSNYCYSVIADKGNSIWVTHKSGVSRKKPSEKVFTPYTRAEGLLSVENNTNATFKDLRGGLWFGTTTGIVYFNAEMEKNNLVPPKVSITSVSLNNVMHSPQSSIVKPYGDYSSRIDFIGVSLADPSKVIYKYRLLGLDSQWRYTNNRYVEFPKLNDGEYTFQLLARNNEGQWSTSAAQLRFTIELPVWKKAWFYALMAIFIVGITYSIIYWRTRSLHRAKLLLEKKVKQKTYLLQKEKEVVEQIKVELEIKNKDITDSINYARRIQEALLPAKKKIMEKLPETFFYYQPRDIVSGDFYWFAETREDYIIAAVDCTGHGVPGAFMSLIGSTLLNDIVNRDKETVPGDILEELNERIILTLNQEQSDVYSHDGMDMSICKINKQKTAFTFAGASRPLYLIRNQNLEELKGDSFSIGGQCLETQKSFTNYHAQLQSGDMIYMFSDGFVDQFNERNNKKFTSRQFKQLLKDIAPLPVQTQYQAIKSTFETWKGEAHQIDDVLVIGIRV